MHPNEYDERQLYDIKNTKQSLFYHVLDKHAYMREQIPCPYCCLSNFK
jgi:hypothetical protein